MKEQSILLLTSGSSPCCGSHRRLEETSDGYIGVSCRDNTYMYAIIAFILTLLHTSLLKIVT